MTPERERAIRRECEECLNERVTFTDPPIECDHCRDKIDTLDALDAERAAHAETKAALEEVVMQRAAVERVIAAATAVDYCSNGHTDMELTAALDALKALEESK